MKPQGIQVPRSRWGLIFLVGGVLTLLSAGDVLLFDAGRGRVIAAEECFRVKGLVNANVLGQNTLIEIDEDQHFLMRIHDKQP